MTVRGYPKQPFTNASSVTASNGAQAVAVRQGEEGFVALGVNDIQEARELPLGEVLDRFKSAAFHNGSMKQNAYSVS